LQFLSCFPTTRSRGDRTHAIAESPDWAAVIVGDAIAAPRVRDFSWQDQKIGVEDASFHLDFTLIECWMVYTVLTPGSIRLYQVQLNRARDSLRSGAGNLMQQLGVARTRDRALVYLVWKGNRTISSLQSHPAKKTILTPKHLARRTFKPLPSGRENFIFRHGAYGHACFTLICAYTVTITGHWAKSSARRLNRFFASPKYRN